MATMRETINEKQLENYLITQAKNNFNSHVIIKNLEIYEIFLKLKKNNPDFINELSKYKFTVTYEK